MSIQISTTGQILIGSTSTGYGVKQTKTGTIVYVTDDGRRAKKAEIRLPAERYSLATDAPASGVAGRAQFERDFMDAYQARNKGRGIDPKDQGR